MIHKNHVPHHHRGCDFAGGIHYFIFNASFVFAKNFLNNRVTFLHSLINSGVFYNFFLSFVILCIVQILKISHAEDCMDGERGITFVENDMCLSAVTCANGITPVPIQGDLACPFRVSESSPCEGALLTSFTKVNPALEADVKCVRHLDCSSDQVQAKIQQVEECVDVPLVDFIAAPSDAIITFTVYHTIELELLGKFQLFGQIFLDNVRERNI